MNETPINSIDTNGFKIFEEDFQYSYQEYLTNKLDGVTKEFDQNIINEIVLWKVSRYANLNGETLRLLNQLPNCFDAEKSREVLKSLIKHLVYNLRWHLQF